MGIKDMGIFNGTFSNNGNGKKIRKLMAKFHRWSGPLWPKPVGSINILTHSFSKNTTFLSFDQRNQLRFLKGFRPIMLLRLLLSTCRPSRWQLATTTGRKDLAADIDPPPPLVKEPGCKKDIFQSNFALSKVSIFDT